jgi:hypothetical protein
MSALQSTEEGRAMPVVERIVALVEALRRDQGAFERMQPARRRLLAETCRYIAALADPDKPNAPERGVLGDLKSGARQE